MHEDEISHVVEQLGTYHIVAEYKSGDGDVIERATITLSRQEMLRILADVNSLEDNATRQMDNPSMFTRGFERLLNITRE